MLKPKSVQFRDKLFSISSSLSLRCRPVWLVMILLTLVVASCSNKTADDPLADRSFLTQQPCAAPCWYGLEPDKSNANDVHNTLNKLSFVDPTTIVEQGTTWLGDDTAKAVGFDCLHPKDAQCGGILTLSQGNLKQIVLSPSYRLTFQMSADRLGSPDYMDYRPFNPEGTGCVITLIWSKESIYLTSIDSTNAEPCRRIRETSRVDPDILVTQIYYVARNMLIPGSKGYFTNSIPWPGFAQP